MLLQHVAAADYSLCTGQETSCSNTCRRQITPCAQVRRQVAATRCGDRLLHVYRSGDQLQQHVSAIDYSLCTGQEISCRNTCRRQITPCVQVRRLVAATRVSDRLLPVYRSGDKLQQYVSATRRLMGGGRKKNTDGSQFEFKRMPGQPGENSP